jgi:hypothetical protein
MLRVPLPTPGGARLHYQMLGNYHPPIQIFRPSPESLPLLDLPFDSLFRCLSVENILTAMALLLLEKKVVLFSSHSSLPNEVVELLKSLIFPFTWQCPCLPRLADDLLGVLDCPTAFIIGIVKRDETQHFRRYAELDRPRTPRKGRWQTNLHEVAGLLGSNANKRISGTSIFTVRRQLAQAGASLPPDAYVIDLDCNRIEVQEEFYDSAQTCVSWRVSLFCYNLMFTYDICVVGSSTLSHIHAPPTIDSSSGSGRSEMWSRRLIFNRYC